MDTENQGFKKDAVGKNEIDQIFDDEEQERATFEAIVNAFRAYKRNSLKKIALDFAMFSRLPEQHQALLRPSVDTHFVKLRQCITCNASLLKECVTKVGSIFENRDHTIDIEISQIRPTDEIHMDKLRCTLRQIVRDWSAQGAIERHACYDLILTTLTSLYPDISSRESVQILVPGSGLGRLAWELAKLGFSTQGNEFSLFMLFMSNFILNQCVEIEQFVVYPWIHQTCNNWTFEDQLAPVRFPDVDPSNLPKRGNSFSMAAGDFLQIYANDFDTWDCVTTVFFLDTASNVVEYIESIRRMLKPTGKWLNFGPLLYHFADSPDRDSIELPYSEIRKLVIDCGFRFDHEQLNVPCQYTQNPLSMLQYRYECVFFVCTKIDKQ